MAVTNRFYTPGKFDQPARQTPVKSPVLKCWLPIFHQDFLESEGIIVNPPESMPTDPYIERRKKAAALRTYTTPPAFDKLKQFLELDRKVLRFFCMWDDRSNMFGEMRPFVIPVSYTHLTLPTSVYV